MFKHPFHLVSSSPWPLVASFSILTLVCGLVLSISSQTCFLLYLGTFLVCLTSLLWWFCVVYESTYLGLHSLRVQAGLRIGMTLFIVSEAFFFFGFFWAYLHCGLSPNVELGSCWPPPGLKSISAFHVPLLNTAVLLTSGATVTWSHSSLLRGSTLTSLVCLASTILLGTFFTLLQCYEYYSCSFCISDSRYGSCFYLATGFHGLHVIIGTLFLLVCLLRIFCFHFRPFRHLGFVFACWYWHFVDVIWVLLFLIIYVWGA